MEEGGGKKWRKGRKREDKNKYDQTITIPIIKWHSTYDALLVEWMEKKVGRRRKGKRGERDSTFIILWHREDLLHTPLTHSLTTCKRHRCGSGAYVALVHRRHRILVCAIAIVGIQRECGSGDNDALGWSSSHAHPVTSNTGFRRWLYTNRRGKKKKKKRR